jgi:hypothetical protein
MRILITLMLTILASPVAFSSIISWSGNQFDDRGTSTVDIQTNLEWLDVTETFGRGYSDVLQDTITSGGQFSPSENWRFATLEEFNSLANNWFGLSISGRNHTSIDDTGFNGIFGNNDFLIVEEFIRTFGDTTAASLALQTNPFVISPTGTGRIFGYLAGAHPTIAGAFNSASILDNEFSENHLGVPSDQGDIFSTNSGAVANPNGTSLGSFLVRNASVTVSEPPVFYLLIVSLIALLLRARQLNLISKFNDVFTRNCAIR